MAGSDILLFIGAFTHEPAISAGLIKGEYVGKYRMSWPSDKPGAFECARALSNRMTNGESTRTSISERIFAKISFDSPDDIVW